MLDFVTCVSHVVLCVCVCVWSVHGLCEKRVCKKRWVNSLLICYRLLKIQLLTNLLHSFVESELKEVPPRFWSRINLLHRTDKDFAVAPFHWVASGELSSVVSVMPFPFIYIRIFFMCHFLTTLLSRLHTR